MKIFALLFSFANLVTHSSFAATGTPLTLADYLSQVHASHDGVKSAQISSEAGLERSQEGDLILAPSLFAQAGRSLDQKPNPFLTYQKLNTDSYALGVGKQTSFGLLGKLSYNLTRSEYVGLPLGFGPNPPTYFEGRPQLELTQSIWRNGFGSETRAARDAIDAAALASHFASSYKLKGLLAEAEITYWRLVLAKENVAVQKEASGRSQKLYDWSARREKLQLADKADALQAEAALNARQLQLQQALDDERSAARALNLARGVSSDEVKETLPTMDSDILNGIQVPQRADLRDDVKAAQQSDRTTQANAQLAIEKNSPSLDLFGSFALNSKDPSSSTAISASFRNDRPSVVFGVKFTAPLDLSAVSATKAGWAREKAAAELNTQRKILEQESDWAELNQKLGESKKRLELALKIEDAQKRKLTHERERLNRGRTTTYQVLLFEQDFSQAQLARLQLEAEIINILAQMKTFGSQS